jgi:ankyrin repeat protein
VEGGADVGLLYIAALNMWQNLAQSLLDKGADVHAQGGYFGNALQAASTKGSREIVRLLLDKGAHVSTGPVV